MSDTRGGGSTGTEHHLGSALGQGEWRRGDCVFVEFWCDTEEFGTVGDDRVVGVAAYRPLPRSLREEMAV